MMLFDSPANPLVKNIASLSEKKFRDEVGLILVEGQHPIEEAFRAGLTVKHLFQREDLGEEDRFVGIPETVDYYLASVRAMAKMSTTETPPPVLATVEPPTWSVEDLFKKSPTLLMVLDGVQDPGNLGTLIRSAAAFGVSGIYMTQGTVDPFSPKVIRSSAGLVFALPIIQGDLPIGEFLKVLKEKNLQTFLTTSHKDLGVSYRETSYTSPCAFVLGSEASGLPPELLTSGISVITIPMDITMDSLNVGVSGSIILAEASAQRGQTEK